MENTNAVEPRRRNQRYGTIICYLEQSKSIALLLDREPHDPGLDFESASDRYGRAQPCWQLRNGGSEAPLKVI